MERRTIWTMILPAILLVACPQDGCDNAGPTSPGPPVQQPDDGGPTEPTFPKTKPFSWGRYKGFSAFAATRLASFEVHNSYAFVNRKGYNTFRTCAELDGWDGGEYFPNVPKDIKQVERFLNNVAAIKGAQVLLVPICTIRDQQPDQQEKWLAKVLELASNYKNVAIEFVNEPWHAGSKASWDIIGEWYVFYKALYPEMSFGADDHWGEFHRGHPLAGLLDFASYHPARDRDKMIYDPSRSELQAMVDDGFGMAVLSETVAWHFTENHPFGALVTTDKNRVIAYKQRCLATPGCKWTTHTVEGLDGRRYTWVP